MSKSRKLIERIERKELFSGKKKKISDKKRTPLSITHNKTLPNISKIVNRNWNICKKILNSTKHFKLHR